MAARSAWTYFEALEHFGENALAKIASNRVCSISKKRAHHINLHLWVCKPPSEEIRVQTFGDENIVNIDVTSGNP